MSNLSLSAEAQALLDFWFAAASEPLWFKQDDTFDRTLAEQFGGLAADAAAGRCRHWSDTPHGALALVILLDQLPRNLNRGSPAAYAGDAQARAAADAAIARGFDVGLSDNERTFLYLPFEHSENLADQERAVALFSQIGLSEAGRRAVLRHREIIARFGRFPHRNAVLGRASTPPEIAFLAEPHSSF